MAIKSKSKKRSTKYKLVKNKAPAWIKRSGKTYYPLTNKQIDRLNRSSCLKKK